MKILNVLFSPSRLILLGVFLFLISSCSSEKEVFFEENTYSNGSISDRGDDPDNEEEPITHCDCEYEVLDVMVEWIGSYEYYEYFVRAKTGCPAPSLCNQFSGCYKSDPDCQPPGNACADVFPVYNPDGFFGFNCEVNPFSQIAVGSNLEAIECGVGTGSATGWITVRIVCCDQFEGSAQDNVECQGECYYSPPKTFTFDGSGDEQSLNFQLTGCGCDPT